MPSNTPRKLHRTYGDRDKGKVNFKVISLLILSGQVGKYLISSRLWAIIGVPLAISAQFFKLKGHKCLKEK